MKISKIQSENNIYTVTFIPTFIERFFGKIEYTKKYKDTGNTYSYGGGSVYVSQDGKELGNNMGDGSWIREAIDCWRRKF